MLSHLLLITPLLVSSPQTQPAATQPADGPGEDAPARSAAFVDAVEAAHGKEAWDEQGAMQSGIVVNFGGNEMINGTMTFTPSMSRVRMDLQSGVTLLWTDGAAWISPADAEVPMARFHVLTWPYFLALPFKLTDDGANVAATGEMPLREDESLPTARLTFDAGIGDAPDDWYILYRDPDDDTLAAAAYIVTYDTARAEAEKEPHAIVYDGFTTIDGVTLSRDWTFYNWSAERGVHGEPIGRVTLRDIRFIAPDRSTFARPTDARELPKPQ